MLMAAQGSSVVPVLGLGRLRSGSYAIITRYIAEDDITTSHDWHLFLVSLVKV